MTRDITGETTGENSSGAWLQRSVAAQAAGDFDGMLAAALEARTGNPPGSEAGLRLAECYLLCGQVQAAVRELEVMEQQAGNNPLLLQQIGERYTQCSQFTPANRCYRRAVDVLPGDAGSLYNLAASCIALGQMTEAENLLDEVIRLAPTDYDAWQNRSTLRRQTPQNNHIRQLQAVHARLAQDDPGRAPVSYALARELEDLQRFDESFSYLQQGAMARREQMDYDVGNDIATMELIQQTFTPALLHSRPVACDSRRPIFVLGLPRSGTTLVDRIVSAHSQVASLGEINTLAFSVMRTAAGSASATASSRSELITQSAQIEFSVLGDQYIEAIDGYGLDASRLVDKTPLNFLYLGLIRLAMPHARIIHLRRNPVDSCYAMYKTLFRMGYPFTYSLQEVGRYYIAYHRLMAHWRNVAPGSFLDVDYEKLVTHQEDESRRILDWCGLDWEAACLDFYKSSSPAATASAAQVRQPMYTSSVELWRKYEKQLAPFVSKLKEHGIAVD